MSTFVFVVGFGLFVSCLIFHIALWRVARPRSDIRALIAIFFGVPTIVALGLLVIHAVVPVATTLERCQVLPALVLHVALSAGYVQTYPAVQAQSPSLEIALAVSRSEPGGLSREQLLAMVNTGQLVSERIEDLVANRLIRARGDQFVLTPFATTLVRFFSGMRFVLGLPKRGG